MKKQWLIAGILIMLEQSIKVLIWNFAMEKRITFIPNSLRFEPYQNTNLNWIASMASIVAPVFLMVLFQFTAAIGIMLLYRYQRYLAAQSNLWLDVGFCTALTGIICSFIDVVFWGGSLDYIGLFDWFIFDMKDVFLHVGWISIFIWFNSSAYKTRKAEITPFKVWLLSGCKLT